MGGSPHRGRPTRCARRINPTCARSSTACATRPTKRREAMPVHDRRTSLIVGLFALTALGALAVAILSLSSKEGVFGSRYRLVGYYENVQGLISNAPVW